MGTLYVVSTPIGNLEDVTHRALRVLREADLVYAEDTRRTRTLLQRYEVDAHPRSLHAHNEASRIEQILAALRADGQVALVSDAGTPLLCDPGERAVAAAIEDGHRIEAVPGASAVLAALALSGLPAMPFAFLGFLPRRDGERRRLLASYRDRPETLVCFESPHRVGQSLETLFEELGPRCACVARELTKLHEEVVRGGLEDLKQRFAGTQRGEFTLVIAGASAVREPLSWPEVESQIKTRLAEGGRPREIAAELFRPTGQPRREIYARAVALRDKA